MLSLERQCLALRQSRDSRSWSYDCMSWSCLGLAKTRNSDKSASKMNDCYQRKTQHCCAVRIHCHVTRCSSSKVHQCNQPWPVRCGWTTARAYMLSSRLMIQPLIARQFCILSNVGPCAWDASFSLKHYHETCAPCQDDLLEILLYCVATCNTTFAVCEMRFASSVSILHRTAWRRFLICYYLP